MAIVKSMTGKNGCTMEYHKIELIKNDKDKVRVNLLQYKDAAAKAAGAEPVQKQAIAISKSDLDMSTLGFPEMYEHLKTLAEFSGAQDA